MSGSTITAKIQGIIDFLEECKADAEKFDRGFDAPGVRLRKSAQVARNDLGDLRALVQAERKVRKSED